jgi:hypothetical protein
VIESFRSKPFCLFYPSFTTVRLVKVEQGANIKVDTGPAKHFATL